MLSKNDKFLFFHDKKRQKCCHSRVMATPPKNFGSGHGHIFGSGHGFIFGFNHGLILGKSSLGLDFYYVANKLSTARTACKNPLR